MIADAVLVDCLLALYGYLDSILRILGLISTDVIHQIDGLISVFNFSSHGGVPHHKPVLDAGSPERYKSALSQWMHVRAFPGRRGGRLRIGGYVRRKNGGAYVDVHASAALIVGHVLLTGVGQRGVISACLGNSGTGHIGCQ